MTLNDLPFVSILVLNYNGKHFLKDCFSSIREINYPISKYEVVFVDNGSTDDSLRFVQDNFPWIKTVRLEKNLGFGGGNNLGIRFIKGDLVVFLNNDTKVTKNWLLELVTAYLQNSHQIYSSKTLFLDAPDIIDYGGGQFTMNGRGFSVSFGKKNDTELSVELTGYPCAASMLLEKKMFISLGGFDENYFACLDDTDLGWRAWLFGYSNYFCSRSIVYHEAGGTAGKNRLSPLKIFYGTKAPLITVTKNLELRNLFLGYFLVLTYDIFEIILLLKAKNFLYVRKKFEAYAWFFRNLRSIINKRHFIQERRIVSDNWLMKNNFLVNFAVAYREYKRLGKIVPQT